MKQSVLGDSWRTWFNSSAPLSSGRSRSATRTSKGCLRISARAARSAVRRHDLPRRPEGAPKFRHCFRIRVRKQNSFFSHVDSRFFPFWPDSRGCPSNPRKRFERQLPCLGNSKLFSCRLRGLFFRNGIGCFPPECGKCSPWEGRGCHDLRQTNRPAAERGMSANCKRFYVRFPGRDCILLP